MPIVLMQGRWLLVCMALGACLGAKAATTQPVAEDYARLNDPRASVREAARGRLLHLSPDDLPRLLAAVRAHPPTAAQTPVLRETVNEAFLRTVATGGQSKRGFLGITLGMVMLDERGGVAKQLVTVESRMPGFVGYRALEDGDVIMTVTAQREVAIDSVSDLQREIFSLAAGTPVTLTVLRGGRLVDVRLTLDAIPEALSRGDALNMPIDPTQFQAMQNRRQQEARQYWQEHFAPLCK